MERATSDPLRACQEDIAEMKRGITRLNKTWVKATRVSFVVGGVLGLAGGYFLGKWAGSVAGEGDDE
jgi:hypothetical protein